MATLPPDTAQLIMQLMRQGNKRGLPMKASPELNAYLDQAFGIRGGPSGPGGNVLPMDPRMGAGDMPPPISRDPWYDQHQPEGYEPQISYEGDPGYVPIPESESLGDTSGMREQLLASLQEGEPGPRGPSGEVIRDPRMAEREAAMNLMGAPKSGAKGPFYIYVKGRQGQRTRLDGPFDSETVAMRELKLLSQSSKTHLPMEIGT